MIEIKSDDLRKAVQSAYEFDKQHGTRAYYFDNSQLFGYEDK